MRFRSVHPAPSLVALSVPSVAVFCTLCAPAGAQALRTLPFQGRLTTPTGASVPDGSVPVHFALYDRPAGTFDALNEPQTISLTHVFLSFHPVVDSSEVVQSADGSVTFNRGVAYNIDYPSGIITSLTIPDGTPIKVTYKYTAALLWQEDATVTVKDGVFSTAIGQNTPFGLPLFTRPPYFLGVSVSGDPEMTPRLQVQGAPYALSLPGFRTLPGTRGYSFVANTILPNNLPDGTSNTVQFGENAGILSGGEPGWPNFVAGDYCLVAGGAGNAIGDGSVRGISYGFIGGGFRNNLKQFGAVIGGGEQNTAGGFHSGVLGGKLNTASGDGSVVAGGHSNIAQGTDAAIPGGQLNVANGKDSLAAGFGASAVHDNSFVWQGDPAVATFPTSAASQFLVNAPGGVGIDTNTPATALDVNGIVTARSGVAFSDGTTQTTAGLTGATGWMLSGNGGTAASAFLGTTDAKPLVLKTQNAERARLTETGRLGIGTVTPSKELEVQGAGDVEIGLKSTDANGRLWTIQSTAAPGTGGTNGIFQIVDRVANLSRLSINTTGNIGIGTTAPETLLHIFKGSAGAVTTNVNTPLTVENNTSSFIEVLAPNVAEAGILFGNPTSNVDGGVVFNSPANPHGMQFRTGNNVERMVIDSTGDVAIGLSAPASGFKLDVNGAIHCIGFSNTSDARYKTNVAPLSRALDTVLHLRGVSFDWRRSDYPALNFPRGRQVGFLAQDVEKVLPEVVSTDNNGYKAISYQTIVPVLVEAIKDQQREIAARDRHLATMEQRLEQLERMMDTRTASR